MEINMYNKVAKFIRSLEKEPYAKTTHAISLLAQFGYIVGMPYSKSLSNGLFELRIRGQQEIRIFYCFYNSKVYLLHAIIKKSQRTPIQELKLARQYKKELTSI